MNVVVFSPKTSDLGVEIMESTADQLASSSLRYQVKARPTAADSPTKLRVVFRTIGKKNRCRGKIVSLWVGDDIARAIGTLGAGILGRML